MCHFSLYISGQFMQPNSALLWSTWPRAFLKEYLLAPSSWKCRNIQPKNVAGVGKYQYKYGCKPGLGLLRSQARLSTLQALVKARLEWAGPNRLRAWGPAWHITNFSDLFWHFTTSDSNIQLWHIALKFQWLWNYDNFDLLMLSELQPTSKFFDKFGVTTFFWSDLVNFG